jgi:RNA polymerase sigma factor (sigma-70 family)
MPPTPIDKLLSKLGSADPHDAWQQFLTDFSGHIYQVIQHLEPNADNAADCFQFVCEQLIRERAKRLRKFKGEGPATFCTWLRAVVRNLCIDWHRKQFGRPRPFRSVTRLSSFDQEVFHLVYEQNTSVEESLNILASGFPNVTEAHVEASRQRINHVLTPNQRWTLTQRAAHSNGSERQEEIEALIPDYADPRPDPELIAVKNERTKNLERALASLSPQEQLLIRLRFEEDLTLDQVAKVLGLDNAQRADRQIKQVIEQLRRKMD